MTRFVLVERDGFVNVGVFSLHFNLTEYMGRGSFQNALDVS